MGGLIAYADFKFTMQVIKARVAENALRCTFLLRFLPKRLHHGGKTVYPCAGSDI